MAQAAQQLCSREQRARGQQGARPNPHPFPPSASALLLLLLLLLLVLLLLLLLLLWVSSLAARASVDLSWQRTGIHMLDISSTRTRTFISFESFVGAFLKCHQLDRRHYLVEVV